MLEEEDERTDRDYNYEEDVKRHPIRQDDLVVSDAEGITRT